MERGLEPAIGGVIGVGVWWSGEAGGGRSEEKEEERRRESLLKERVPRGESCTAFCFLMCSLFWCVILVVTFETVNRPVDVSPQMIWLFKWRR